MDRLRTEGPRGWELWHSRCLAAEIKYRLRFVYKDGEDWIWQTDDELHYFLNGSLRRRTLRRRTGDGTLFHELGVRRGAEYSFYATLVANGTPVPTEVNPVPESPERGMLDPGVSLPFCCRKAPLTELISDPAFHITGIEVCTNESYMNGPLLTHVAESGSDFAKLGDKAEMPLRASGTSATWHADCVELHYTYQEDGPLSRFLKGDGIMFLCPDMDWAIVGWETTFWNPEHGRSRVYIQYTNAGGNWWPSKSVDVGFGNDDTNPLALEVRTYEICRESHMPMGFFSFEDVGLPNLAAAPEAGMSRMAWFVLLNLGVAGLFLWNYWRRRRRKLQ